MTKGMEPASAWTWKESDAEPKPPVSRDQWSWPKEEEPGRGRDGSSNERRPGRRAPAPMASEMRSLMRTSTPAAAERRST
jgi:hypothetical protein